MSTGPIQADPETPPATAVEHFAPATSALTWHRASPGFSGAVVWRGTDAAGTPRVALKGWPPATTPERIHQIHLWQARVAHLPFVPTVLPGARAGRVIHATGRLWDACQWVPGTPPQHPTSADVQGACEAIARLHRSWPAGPTPRPCRGIVARLEMLLTHRPLYARAGPHPPSTASDLGPLLHRAARAVARLAEPAVAALRSWAERPLGERPCVRDLRAEHVLFEGGAVTGIVDYGAMALDNPAVDLARFLGDCAAADPELFDVGVSAYRRAGGPLDSPDAFVALLARTGAVCSVLGWLVRAWVLREPVPPPAAARLAEQLARTESIRHF